MNKSKTEIKIKNKKTDKKNKARNNNKEESKNKKEQELEQEKYIMQGPEHRARTRKTEHINNAGYVCNFF